MKGKLYYYGNYISTESVEQVIDYVANRLNLKGLHKEKVKWEILQNGEYKGYVFKKIDGVRKVYNKPVHLSDDEWFSFTEATDDLFDIYTQDRRMNMKGYSIKSLQETYGKHLVIDYVENFIPNDRHRLYYVTYKDTVVLMWARVTLKTIHDILEKMKIPKLEECNETNDNV